MKYKRIKFVEKGAGECRAVYRVDRPVEYGAGKRTEYVTSDFAYTFDHGPETMIFPCDKNGLVLDWGDLFCLPYDGVSDDSAIEMFCHDESDGGAAVVPEILPTYIADDIWPVSVMVRIGGEERTYKANGVCGRPGNPVLRSDGKRYDSAMDAARAIAAEQGCGNIKSIAGNIRSVCKGVNHHKTAYGYGFVFCGHEK